MEKSCRTCSLLEEELQNDGSTIYYCIIFPAIENLPEEVMLCDGEDWANING